MTAAASKSKPVWLAEVQWAKRYYATEEKVPNPEVKETADGAIAAMPESKTIEVLHGVIECYVHVSRPG
jgi:hypothetical protein